MFGVDSSTWTRSAAAIPSMPIAAPPKGLTNLGNTCYVNSVMTALAYCDCVYEAVINSTHTYDCDLHGLKCVLCCFEKCIMDIRQQPSYGRGLYDHSRLPVWDEEAFYRHGTHSYSHRYGSHDTSSSSYRSNPTSSCSIIDLLPQICSDFFVGKQEDAHEFLTRVLASLCNDPTSSSSSKSTQLQAVLKRGVLCSRVVCSNCSTESLSRDEFFGLELEISRSDSLSDALYEFCRIEDLSAATHNAFHCQVCSSAHQQQLQLQSAQKSLRLLQLPRLLCLQLKRFSCQQTAPWRSSKLCHRVQYPILLDMSPYCTCNPVGSGSSSSSSSSSYMSMYRLSAVIVHRGSLDDGHYVTYVRSDHHHHNDDSRGGCQWWLVDDSKVARVEQEEALSQSAYVLLYERIRRSKDGFAVDGSLEADAHTTHRVNSIRYVDSPRADKRTLFESLHIPSPEYYYSTDYPSSQFKKRKSRVLGEGGDGAVGAHGVCDNSISSSTVVMDTRVDEVIGMVDLPSEAHYSPIDRRLLAIDIEGSAAEDSDSSSSSSWLFEAATDWFEQLLHKALHYFSR